MLANVRYFYCLDENGCYNVRCVESCLWKKAMWRCCLCEIWNLTWAIRCDLVFFKIYYIEVLFVKVRKMQAQKRCNDIAWCKTDNLNMNTFVTNRCYMWPIAAMKSKAEQIMTNPINTSIWCTVLPFGTIA